VGEHLLVKYYNNDILESDNHVHLNNFYGMKNPSFLNHIILHPPPGL